jgi:CheY-like chemotaxis protein
VAKTLLAVDDSTTMRKVLEITFSGEDFRVITAESGNAALGKLGENPNVFVIDTVLGGEDGYAVAKEIRRRAPGAPIIMLASRYSPYDQARGRDAGADDWADKPFDTQQLIDKVRKVIVAKEAGVPQQAPMAAPPMHAPQPAPAYRAPAPPPMAAPQPVSGIGRGTQPSLGGSAQGARSGTLVFGDSPQPAPVAARPVQHHAPAPAPAPAPPPPAAAAVSSAVNGQLAGKLGELGLTPQQADAVLALSREVVERVVWEVVPQLAETIIKEEIARLTKEG